MGLARALRALLCVSLLALALAPASAVADARSEYLIRLLEGSTQFRVRAQAAISLGSVDAAGDVLRALSTALSDEHPAVRAAAASSLGRLGDAKAIPILRSASEDPEAPVRLAVKSAIVKLESASRMAGVAPEPVKAPSGPPRYYVAVAKPASRVGDLPSTELDRAHQVLVERLKQIDGVVIAPADESPAAVRKVLRSQSLRGFYIDSSVTNVDAKPGGGTRVAVSVIVATYPDRAMRAIMQGTATALGGGDTRAQAVAGAFRSALSQLPQALARE
jgi:HEAT repeat protein